MFTMRILTVAILKDYQIPLLVVWIDKNLSQSHHLLAHHGREHTILGGLDI